MAGGSYLPSQNDLNLLTVLFRDLRFNLFLNLSVSGIQDHHPRARCDHDFWVLPQLCEKLLKLGFQVGNTYHGWLSKTLLAAL